MKKVKLKINNNELLAIATDLKHNLPIEADATDTQTDWGKRVAIGVLTKWNHKMIGRLQFHKAKYSITLDATTASAFMKFYECNPFPIFTLIGNAVHTIKNEINQQLC